MWLLEDEARNKWCPFALVIEREDQSSGNRGVDRGGLPWIGSQHMCLGSDCMAWRMSRDPNGEALGYCGLCSRPI